MCKVLDPFQWNRVPFCKMELRMNLGTRLHVHYYHFNQSDRTVLVINCHFRYNLILNDFYQCCKYLTERQQ